MARVLVPGLVASAVVLVLREHDIGGARRDAEA
jgi:hypothetical protein